MAHIGIDLGTTNSLVSICENGNARVLANELGEIMTPSVVAMDDDGSTLVGRSAKDHLVLNPKNGMSCFKRDMGTEKSVSFGGRSWTPVELSAVILKEMKRIAEMQLDEEIESAVISVPAYFHDGPRQATMDAAEIAGLKVSRLINEPTAAALAYGCQNRDIESTLMIFDIGGGTFDVTILEIFEQIIDVKASGGISRLGGEDYLDSLVNYICKKLELDLGDGDRAKIRYKAEMLKRQLSSIESTTFEWQDKRIDISRQDFSDITRELTERLRPVVVRCLRDAGLGLGEIDSVVLVGGASRMPVVSKLVKGLSSGNILDGIDPDTVVAMGTAVQAALVDNDAAVNDVVLTDVAPHSLGIDIAREVRANQFEEGLYSPIIDRNSTLPISRSNVYSTFSPMVDEVILQIYQGEHRFVKENHHLGSLKVNGLRAKPGQMEAGLCEVRFTYDMSGIIEVEATVLATNKKVNVVIEERPGQLSKEEIEKAIKRLQPLKVKMRDLLPNRARIEQALRLYEDLNGAYREHLEQLLGQFEYALEQQDEQGVKWSGTALDQFMNDFFEDSASATVESKNNSVEAREFEAAQNGREGAEQPGPWLPDDQGADS